MHSRTGQSHPLQINDLGRFAPGRPGLTPCPDKCDHTPGCDRDLDTDLLAMCDGGATTMVTLMESMNWNSYRAGSRRALLP